MAQQTNVSICDMCKDRIAKDKCQLCKNDICSYRACLREFRIQLRSGGDSREGIISIPFCRRCWDKVGEGIIYRKDFWDEEFLKKISKDFEDYIRKRVILDKLEDKK
ncbi:hypothetical protein LCGC14_2506210 [marine sediment metagenome]|uniref:Uncharacterized protein n=1 Tax=marine sediment metagenome TaxID=412755 RepID=A0A0F9B165_9ZZZZ